MRWAKKEILWVWVVVGADILALGTLTGFWQNLFLPTPNHPLPSKGRQNCCNGYSAGFYSVNNNQELTNNNEQEQTQENQSSSTSTSYSQSNPHITIYNVLPNPNGSDQGQGYNR
jgi:hypothetical protein